MIPRSIVRFAAAGVAALALLGLLPGCTENSATPFPGPNRTLVLSIQGKSLDCEIAMDDQTRRVGLMFRESLAENAGMIFGWRAARKQSFHMANVPFPLSIAFLSEDGEILQIADMRARDEKFTLSDMPVRWAIEVNQGWFSRNGIKVGDRFDEFRSKVEGLAPQ